MLKLKSNNLQYFAEKIKETDDNIYQIHSKSLIENAIDMHIECGHFSDLESERLQEYIENRRSAYFEFILNGIYLQKELQQIASRQQLKLEANN